MPKHLLSSGIFSSKAFLCQLVFLAAFLGAGKADRIWAQINVPDVAGHLQSSQDDLRQSIREEERLRRVLQEPPKIVVEGFQPDELDLARQSDAKVIPAGSFVFDPPSAVLPKHMLDAITEPYVGKTISLRDIYTIAHEIDLLYDSLGVIGRTAVPSQDIKADGVIRFHLVEGRVGNVRIVQEIQPVFPWKNPRKKTIYDSRFPSCYASPSLFSTLSCGSGSGVVKCLTDGFHPGVYDGRFVRKGIDVKRGNTIQTRQLEDVLQRYNLTHESNLQVRMEPGLQPGESDLEVLLTSPKLIQGTLYFDNFGRKMTGLYRGGITTNIHNLTGRGDSWFFNGVLSDGSGIMNGYLWGSIPVTPRGISLNGSFEYNNYSIISGPYTVLEVDGWSRRETIGLSAPVMINRTRLVKLDVTGSFYQSANYFSNFVQQETRVNSVAVGLSQERFGKTVYRSAGISLLSGYGKDAKPSSMQYFLVRGSYTYVKKLRSESSLIAKIGFQGGGRRNLPAIEQMTLGGIASVRGYSEGLLSGDSAYFVNLEYHVPLFDHTAFSGKWHRHGKRARHQLSGFVFADHGGCFPYKGDNRKVDIDDFLFSTGAGLNYNLGERTSAKLVAGIPLYKNEHDPDYEDLRLHFMVAYRF